MVYIKFREGGGEEGSDWKAAASNQQKPELKYIGENDNGEEPVEPGVADVKLDGAEVTQDTNYWLNNAKAKELESDSSQVSDLE
ncbi:MAG: hypothetical protein WCP91_00550 [Candidatus Berkelbacteria bacterium]